MKKLNKNVLKRFHFLEKMYYFFTVPFNYKTEISLLKQRSVSNTSSSQSVIHFSINKAATQYVKNVLQTIAAENKIVSVNMNGYAMVSKIPFFQSLSYEEMENYKHVFKPKGYLYTVFNAMICNVDEFDKYNVIFSIRDPRDILVSNYYSKAFSHSVPPISGNKREKFLKMREWVKSIEIDEYVLSYSDRLYQVFDEYKNKLVEKHPHIAVLKYEDMISDYPNWLNELTTISGMTLSEELRTKLTDSFYENRVKKEDIKVHQRKGVAGDYLEKLKPETIEKLNIKFKDLLTFYGYEL